MLALIVAPILLKIGRNISGYLTETLVESLTENQPGNVM
jgi:hypothetical protein